MKNLKKIVFVFSLCICGTITSQTERPIAELLEVLSQNHMGSVTDVFNLSEIELIKNYYAQTTFPSNRESVLLTKKYSSTQSVTTIQACDIDDGNLNTIDVLANSPITEFPGAGFVSENPSDGVVIIDNENTLWLRGMPPVVTYQNLGGLTGVPPGHSITGVELLTAPNGQLFGMSTNGVDDSRLVNIDVNTRTVTPIGNNNGLILPIALGRDGNDNLITLDIDDDNTYSVNPITGVPSLIGPSGYDANFGQALYYDQYTDKVMNIAYNSVIGDSELRILDLVTGEMVSVGTIQPGTVQQFGWGSTYDRDALDLEKSNIDGFSFYPNPSSDLINLKAKDQIETIAIYSVLGQLTLKQSIKARTSMVDITQFVAGTYFLKVATSNQTGVYKLIKQ